MTGFGRDAFRDAEHQATLGWQTTLVTPDGVSWLLNPGGPWLRWAGPNGWLPTPPPMDPGLRLGARRVPPPPRYPAAPPKPMPRPPMLPPQPMPVVTQVKLGDSLKSFVSVGETAWEFLDRVVRVVKWTADAARTSSGTTSPTRSWFSSASRTRASAC
jgi:hypothetical protein